MKIVGIIPARYASTRLPGKPLIDIHGKTMIQRVYEQATKANTLAEVVVATDDERIFQHVTSFGGNVVMTSPQHASGTDRCYEALLKAGKAYDYVINIQGDEPMINPAQIDALAAVLNGQVSLATLIKNATHADELANHGEVKVVLNTKGEALYFSRATIPFVRNATDTFGITQHPFLLHVGTYAYRSDILEQITKLPVSSLEKAESLEQLRWLENGFQIQCVLTDIPVYSIDTPEDLTKVSQLIKEATSK